jgi:hypothetical protein
MNTYTNAFASTLSNTLAATGENFMVEVTNLGAYGTSISITKHGSDRKLHITPVEDDLIDMVLFDGSGSTLAAVTLFPKTTREITSEKLANLVKLCF